MPSTTPLKLSTRPATSSANEQRLNLATTHQVGSRKRRGKRIPIITEDAFVTVHNNEHLIRYAVEPPRRDSVPVGRDVICEMLDDGVYPYANNLTARIAWTRIAEAEGRSFANAAKNVQFYFATLNLAEFMLPYERAHSLALKRVQESARRRFKGVDFLGVVEPALYTETARLTARGRHVCWHVHFISWDVSGDRMRKARSRINRNNISFVPGIKPAHYRPLDRDEVPGKIFYMFKGPQSDHRVYARVEEFIEGETGELLRKPTGRYTQAKGPIRLGDAARMANLLEGTRLDDLAFANGREGNALLKCITDRALGPLRSIESRVSANRK